jgi:hypothetical protein
MPDRPRCQATKKDGTPCTAKAVFGDVFCFAHSEKTKEARERARSNGGKARMLKLAVLPDAADITFNSSADVLSLLSDTASKTRRGEIDCKVANCLSYISATAARVLSDNETETRLKRLEEELLELRKHVHKGKAQTIGSP